MKRTALLALTLSLFTAGHSSAAIVAPGDVMFTGFNADGSDEFAFVLLGTYDANTVIFFSDNEWDGTAWVDSNETFLQWSSGISLSAGTVVTLSNVGSGALTANTGSAVFNEGTNRGFAASGEGLYAFTGSAYNTATPAFLSAFANSGFTSNATGLLTGTGLSAGSTATSFTSGADIFAYTGDRTSQSSFGAYAGLTGNTANWIFEDGSGDQHNNLIAPDVPFDTSSFAIAPVVPEPSTLAFAALLAAPVLMSRRRREV